MQKIYTINKNNHKLMGKHDHNQTNFLISFIADLMDCGKSAAV